MTALKSLETPYQRLVAAGLRPTRQRLGLAALAFNGEDRHLTAEALHEEAAAADMGISLATVYNTLRRFTDCGLLREVLVAPGKVYFDTNVSGHHHFFHEDDGLLVDIPADRITLSELPAAPPGAEIARVDVIIRLSSAKA
jgi:Fur family iron response transcriptional regulator